MASSSLFEKRTERARCKAFELNHSLLGSLASSSATHDKTDVGGVY
jgi:hypothetical protein